MIRRGHSLKRRLMLWMAGLTLIFGSALLLEATLSANREADRVYDGVLDDAILTIAEALQWQDGRPLIAMPAAALQILATPHEERVFYALRGAGGEIITANASLPITARLQKKVAQQPVYRDIDWQGTSLRLAGREFTSAGWETREPVQIWVAHTRGARNALAHDLVARAAMRFILMVGLAIVLVWLAVRASLRPLTRLRHRLRQRHSEDFSPISARVPVELSELVDTLDQLLARQRKSHDRLMRFIADASHQLKTPLAGLQNISELALRSRDHEQWHEALKDIHAGASRSTRLAHQLLQLARLDHDETSLATRLDLTALARERLTDWAQRPASAMHDLGLEVPDHPVWVQATDWQLGELINNLLDNALRYTPPDSVITLGVEETDSGHELFVEDNGPGVPPALRDSLVHPFVRGDRHDTSGSGLGLAVAASIARSHQAQLSITTPASGGLRVALLFSHERHQ
ncbi:sensor histidine kinase [Kushneria phosphatilytica]|uniref:sensor histidine kinase n=1 Tax=Kushneria phosphatilytica TaxID=657387 RepID=UPI0008DA1162|nr:sensor histidine kinase [Kushneria phosphatilytica]OHV12820.1 hypothetical protein BH688_01930 [Kushneria phosphatilytica]